MNSKKVLVVGSLITDLIVSTDKIPIAGQTVRGTSFAKAPGGKGANQAVQIARLGGNVDMVGRVGDDIFGQELIKACCNAGVGTDNVYVTSNTVSGISDVLLEKSDNGQTQNRIIMNPGANNKLTINDIKWIEQSINDYALIVLQFEIPMDVNEFVARIAYENNIPVLLNPAPSTTVSADLLSHITYFVPNETEVKDITGIYPFNNEKNPDLNKLHEAAVMLKSKGVQSVIVTLGHNGVFYSGNGGEAIVPAVKDVVAIDPTAAGDSFIGAFSLAIVNDINPIEALYFANLVASITVETLGAMPSLPTLEKVVQVAKYKKLRDLENIILKLNIGPNLRSNALDRYKEVALTEVNNIIRDLNDGTYQAAVEMILSAQEKGNRVHVTGIGKPAHVAQYYASLLSSTGTPAYFLHGTEVVHGSAGQLVKGDVVIAISNSGETAELKSAITTIKNNHCHIISITGNDDSWLAHNSDISIVAKVSQEGDDLNRAPRISILAELIVLQGLSILLQSRFKLTPRQYIKWHPGGKLGELY